MYCTIGLGCATTTYLSFYMQYTLFLFIYKSMYLAIYPFIDLLSLYLFICHHKLINVYLPFVGPFFA
jgi:hypothetical protein